MGEEGGRVGGFRNNSVMKGFLLADLVSESSPWAGPAVGCPVSRPACAASAQAAPQEVTAARYTSRANALR